jgi:hypothetical protein
MPSLVGIMNLSRSLTTAAALLVLAACPTVVNAQGSLTPPPGPPAPVMKSLDQLEPRTPLSQATTPGAAESVFRISAPGSYYLTGHLSVPAAFSGIEIASDGVTLDLGGFTITGQSGSHYGINASPNPRRSLTVRNGSIRTMGRESIYASAAARDNVFENLIISGGIRSGIWAGNATVRNCAVSQNGGIGIFLQGQAGSLV